MSITTVKNRRGTAAEWSSSNPILADGELGFEKDTRTVKIGDGVTHWNDLSPIKDNVGTSFSLARTSVKTSAYSAAVSQLVPVDTTSGSVTITLPNAPADKSLIAVKHIVQGGTNSVSIARSGSDVFNKTGGSTSLTMSLLNQAVLLQYDAATSVWTVLSDDLPLAALNGAYVPVPATVAPTSPVAGQAWVSSALVDARVSPSFTDRQVVVSPDAGTATQEPSVWTDATNFNMLYTMGNGQCLRQCPLSSDPLVATNWTKIVGAGTNGQVIGAGAGGVAGLVNHGSTYQEGSTLYFYGNVAATNTVDVFTADVSAPATWTRVGTVIATASLPSGATVWGNTRVVKDGATYRMLIEWKGSNGQWQLSWATATTATGTFTLTTGAALQTLWPDSNHQSASGAWLAFENGQWVLVYHLQNTINQLSQVYVATAPTLGTDNFTIQHGGNPIIRRVGFYEQDQVADPEVIRTASGQAYIFWTGIDNRNSTMRIMAAPLQPTRKVWNGGAWAPIDATPDWRATTLPDKPTVVVAAADFAGTATAFTDWPNLSATWYPSGTEAEVTLTAVLTASATGLYQFRISSVDRTSSVITPALGGVDLTAGVRTAVSFKTKLTPMAPFTYRPVKVQYLVPAGATLNCRPVAQAGIEQAVLTVGDAAYRQS